MPVTEVSIANSALIKVGADRISSLTQDTRSAVLIHALFEQLRDQVLTDHPWNFALKRVTLAPNSTEPDFGYLYQYDKPSDCLLLRDVDPDDVIWVVEGDQILTDETSLDMVYTYRNVDPTTWSASFAEALAWRIAQDIAYALTQSSTLADACATKYKQALADARSSDGVEGTPKPLVIDDWTLARR